MSFPQFSALAAELRDKVWEYALHDDYSELYGSDREIELHTYDEPTAALWIFCNKRYPKLFSVNREARAAAARLDGGEWISIPERKPTFFYGPWSPQQLYINFERDTILLSSRFLWRGAQLTRRQDNAVALHERFEALPAIFGPALTRKIRNLRLEYAITWDWTPLDLIEYWAGAGLDVFIGGSLENLTLSTAEIFNEHVGRRDLDQVVKNIWNKMMGSTNCPEIIVVVHNWNTLMFAMGRNERVRVNSHFEHFDDTTDEESDDEHKGCITCWCQLP